jgi:saccharopine dehydrogenase-like NADP-dependent oxidoreductase
MIRMSTNRRRALLLGWRGGVGTAVANLLAHHPTGRRIAAELDALFLIDRENGTPPPPIRGARLLPHHDVDGPAALAALVADHRIDHVIEVADVDTLAFSDACARRHVDYLSTSLQRQDGTAHDQLTMIAASRLEPGLRGRAAGGSQLIGSGMNPGVVNALVHAGLAELARRVGAPPDVAALEVYAIHVTEEDTTALDGGAVADGVFPSSWSPDHCLSEMLEPDAMVMQRGHLLGLGHRPHDRLYQVRCGAAEIAAMIVPHEEIVTLGRRFEAVEAAFFYAIPHAAQRALRADPDRPAAAWPTRKLYPPFESRLVGRDRVGTLIASRRHGELWIGFDTPVEDGLRHGTNATQLQVAAGVLAGWSQLGARRGVHVVEDLDWRAYLAVVEEILGPARVHHAPGAQNRAITARCITT